MDFQCINIRQVSWEVLKTAAFGLGFQHLPRDLANVNAWKTMFDPYKKTYQLTDIYAQWKLKPAYDSRSLIRAFIVRMKNICIRCCTKCTQGRSWPDCENAQADVNLLLSYMSEGKFSDVAAKLSFRYYFTCF